MRRTETASRSKAKRGQILDGARRVFLRDGFAAASTDVISREAGVSKRTLYAYYPSKEDLFAEVLRTVTVEDPRTMVLGSIQDKEPTSREELRAVLLELARRFVATMMQPEYLAFLRTIIADTHRFPQLGEIFRSTVPERGLREGSAMLERAQENGVVATGDPEVMMRMFMGSMLTYAMIDGLFRPEGEHNPPGPGKLEETVDLFVKAVTAGGGPED